MFFIGFELVVRLGRFLEYMVLYVLGFGWAGGKEVIDWLEVITSIKFL